MGRHLGQIVRAGILDYTGDRFYKIRTRIRTGDAAGKECFVAYRGNPNFSNQQDLIVRLNPLAGNKTDLKIKYGVCTGNFVSSKAPKEFIFGPPDTILHGQWGGGMNGGHRLPLRGTISDFYGMGWTSRILFYLEEGGQIVPRMVKEHRNRRVNKTVREALEEYIIYIKAEGREDERPTPIMVLIDENIRNISGRVISEFERTGLQYIEMEPQQ